MFGRRDKLESDGSQKSENTKSDQIRIKDDKEKRRKRKTIMERFRENGYDSGFVYHED